MNSQELEALKRAEAYAVAALKGERRKMYSNTLVVLDILNDLIVQGEKNLKTKAETVYEDAEKSPFSRKGMYERGDIVDIEVDADLCKHKYNVFALKRRGNAQDYIVSSDDIQNVIEFISANKISIQTSWYNFVVVDRNATKTLIAAYDVGELLGKLLKQEIRDNEFVLSAVSKRDYKEEDLYSAYSIEDIVGFIKTSDWSLDSGFRAFRVSGEDSLFYGDDTKELLDVIEKNLAKKTEETEKIEELEEENA